MAGTDAFSTEAFEAQLKRIAAQHGLASTADEAIARILDQDDVLAPLRQEYNLPTVAALRAQVERKTAAGSSSASNGEAVKQAHGQDGDAPALYLCGNSLGAQARRSQALVQRELDVWARVGVLGHFDHPHGQPWVRADDAVNRLMADMVGAKPSEVAAMGSLTANIHNLLATFYRPSSLATTTPLPNDGSIAPRGDKKRHKIVYEWKAFPSDQYALQSVVRLHGYDPAASLVALKPRPGEDLLRTEDILETLHHLAEEGETAILMLSGIQYYTGQFFDIERITRVARSLGIVVGWDLAHAFGNVPLALHDWDVDFAAWCTYKYGSSGPGGIAGLFVHERWTKGVSAEALPRPAGWYGHNRATRFAMPPTFEAMEGAAGFVTSNPSALDLVVLQGALETLAQAPVLAAKSQSQSRPQSSASDPSRRTTTALPPDAFTPAHAERLNALSPSDRLGPGHIMPVLRSKSLHLTAYLAHLLLLPDFLPPEAQTRLLTPRDPHRRGSQLCVRIVDTTARPSLPSHGPERGQESKVQDEGRDGDDAAANGGEEDVPPPLQPTSLLARAHRRAEREHSLIVDVRAPDVIRLAPLAQYSTFGEVWRAARAVRDALAVELREGALGGGK